MYKENLKPKCITDFTKEDTLYIKSEEKVNSNTFLCSFKEIKGSRIVGEILQVLINPKINSHLLGSEVSARLTNCCLYGENPKDNNKSFHYFKSSGYAIYPKDYSTESENSEIINEHPSFGMVSISRATSSHGRVLFGSSIQHKETILLRINSADVNRNLQREWYHSRNEIIEIELSSSQFAELITSPNTTGVPCTIKHINHNMIPEPPYENRKDMFSREFENKMKNLSSDMVENINILEKILDKKTINKGDKSEIKSLFSEIVRPLRDSIPFIEKSFVEQMDNTVKEAKSEVESFVNRRLTEEGRKALLGEDGAIKLLED